jgi:hypothetical protein
MAVRINTAVNRLSKQFQGIRGIQDGEFWGAPGAIHLGDAAEGGEIDGWPAADYHINYENQGYEFGVHPKLVKALDKLGFFAEWYDPGTLLAYRQ